MRAVDGGAGAIAVAVGRAALLGDRYRLLEPLGAGGMGVVYAAFDTKLGRKVAVKRLREAATGRASAEWRRKRFLREAQLLASLSHPNVLTVHDVGGADRELYVVMELVDGAPVSRWLSEAHPPPDWRRIVDVFEQVGRGLVAAHQLGMVHRDVKPENILVATQRPRADRRLRPGRLDRRARGVDRCARAAPGADRDRSDPGHAGVHGPEQHDGKTGDPLSDQFSFACRCSNRCTAAGRSPPSRGRYRRGDARRSAAAGRRRRAARD